MPVKRILNAFAAALLWALLLCISVLSLTAPAAAQTITNIAEAQWLAGTTPQRASSNAVVLSVVQDSTLIETFRPASGGTSTQISAATCQGNPLPGIGVPGMGGSVASVERAVSFQIGDELVFRVTSSRANRNPAAVDRIVAILTTTSGDREEIVVLETGVNSGVFVGAVRTTPIPPNAAPGDCRLSVRDGDTIGIECRTGDERPIAVASVAVMADPFGLIFDSEDGAPVSGVRVSMVDAATGQPASVFADDGVTRWPSTVISGQSVTDAAGNVYQFLPGEYRFPLAPLGSYRLVVETPAPYTAPSQLAPAQLAGLTRPGGEAFHLSDASYGGTFMLTSPAPVRVDIPVDRPSVAVALSKTVSRRNAMPGDSVFYTVDVRNTDTHIKRDVMLVDTPSRWLRLRADTIRIDGEPAPGLVTVAADGTSLTIRFPQIAAGATRRITYAMTVRPDAPEGDVLNRAEATDARGQRSVTGAVLRIERETVGDRMTLIGRVTEGSCLIEDGWRGIPGVRVVLEDGSFAITDGDGRYHFEGLLPGTHVVQAQGQTLPTGGVFVDCDQTTASAGSASSRFVRGQGGSLMVADFHAELSAGWEPPVAEAETTAVDDAEAAGADTDWLAQGDGPAEFLFPELNHNPRAPAVRVVLRHEVGQTVELTVDGDPVDPLAFDGTRAGPHNRYAVSIWRGVALEREVTTLRAVLRGADGSVAGELEREVVFSATPARAELLAEASHLVADGAERPVIAIRVTDRHGRPVRAGISGSVMINAPYESARVLDRLQQQQVAGTAPSSPTWTVEGDDGIARIELAPTMVSGPLHLEFGFVDGEITRRQEIDSWIVPGDQEWTLVGLVEGSAGARSVADNMERGENFDSALGEDARAAFYAKGRVLGRFLLTAAYDSARQEDAARLTGAIDPNAYYSVFADGSLRRFDAASREKLYVRIETDTFYAIYGDIQTGFEQTRLARYARAVTGVRAEGRFGALHMQGFAAETETLFRRDELQGAGISGPYDLSSRAIVANSERVALEVRDRFRSEVIVSRTELQRFVDYDIDLLSGTITFTQPVLSRDANLNPQFIVIDYEIDGLTGSGEWNAGARADLTLADGAVRIGASAISDQGDGERTDLLAADARVTLGGTEFRAEVAASRSLGETATAWLVEAEHHDGSLDLLAYARSVDTAFGVGQLNGVESGRRKFGADARYALSEEFQVLASAWHDESLEDTTSRNAVQAQLGWSSRTTDLTLGIAHFADTLADGTSGVSTLLEGGATQRLLGNRLQLTAATSIALQGTDSIDLPTRHLLGVRYNISSDVALLGTYEIAAGDAIDARTLRGGIEVTPWAGGRVSTGVASQQIKEFGQRSFATFGLTQSLQVSQNLTLDATVDGNRQLGGVNPQDVINPQHPVASGGQLGTDDALFEDFTAVTLGAGWRRDLWALSARGEWRDGEEANRRGFTFGMVRQLGEGSVIGSGFNWTSATGISGTSTEIFDAAISAAHRPAESEIALLGKLEFRSDAVTNAVAGENAPVGQTALTVTGDAQSRRLLASLSTNWSPRRFDDEDGLTRRGELALFLGGRYTFDGFEGYDIEGFTALIGLDARLALGERFELGGRASIRSNLTDGVTSFAFGPEFGFVPTTDMLLTVGYNITGFRDRDYSAARITERGLFASVRMKLDADSFSFLGLRR